MYPQLTKTRLTPTDIFRALLICVFIPNLLFWIASSALAIERPIFNLDYFFSGLAFALGWRKIAAILLTLFLLADALALQGQVYPVLHPRDIAYLVSQLPQAPVAWQALGGAIALLLVTAVIGSYRMSGTNLRFATLCLCATATLTYGIQASVDPASSEFSREKSSLVGSQIAFYVNTRAVMVLDDFFEERNVLHDIGYPDELASWTTSEGRTASQKLLLVVVESWGKLRDSNAHQALLRPIFNNSHRLDWIRTGHLSADATTIEAELRYLCGLGARYLNLKPVVQGFEGCLPWQFKAHGFTTVAVHGAVSNMHNRNSWYPRSGFDEMHFKNTHPWTSECYSFPGVCDREIMDTLMRSVFASSEPRFVYWLTLNTHAPFDERDIWLADAYNCSAHGIEAGSETCRALQLHGQFFHQFSELLMEPAMNGVEIFMVGDHAPPILHRHEFKQHFDPDKVPYIHLRVANGLVPANE